jgi:acetyl esterase/lipase
MPGRILDDFWPETPSRRTAVFFVHGGGWNGGSREQFHSLMRAFNEQGYACASTDYRLKDVNILEQIMDVRHGYDYYRARLTERGHPDRIFVYGSSAGAHLAALLALAAPGACGEALSYRDYVPSSEWVRPVGAAFQALPVTFEPWEDIFPPIWKCMENIARVPYEKQPELYRAVSPIQHISSEAPPIFVLEAANEHMFPHSQSLEFVQKLQAAGCRAERKVYENTEHGFFYGLERRQQKMAFADLLSFVTALDNQS